MKFEEYQRVKLIVDQVMDLDAERRAEALDRACDGDAELRAQVEALLGHVDRPAVDIEGARRELAEAVQRDVTAGLQVPGYRILEVLGEGGMGIVYLAEQENPRRTVALKVIRPGHATPELLARFKRETQVLGRLQHPGIAQIYEAGTADTSLGAQPYFAMEYVRGRPLLEHAEAKGLDVEQRLVLLVRVCQAVQHAHLHGVIHRDLKPSNILVQEASTVSGASPSSALSRHDTSTILEVDQPKVLDFGIARVTDPDGQTPTIRTDARQLIGTIAYMSPEQVAGAPDGLDTRSDVYTLGVIGFELLTGRLPLDLTGRTIADAARAIEETEPARLGSVDRGLRGDLETILAKALEKDPARRYQSAADLALDVQRFLDDQPIEARPASTVYQLRKFATRNKALVGGVAAVFVVLVAGVIGTGLAMLDAQRQRDEAQRQARIAEAVNEFLTKDLLEQADPSEQPDPDVRLRTILDRAAEGIGDRFADEPLIEAAIHTTVGITYRELGRYGDALPHLVRALELRRAELGPDDQDTLHALNNLGTVYIWLERYDEAQPLLEEALERRRRVLGDMHTNTNTSLNDLAGLHMRRDDYDRADALYTEALEHRLRTHGDRDRRTLAVMGNLVDAKRARGRLDEAEALGRRTLELRREVLGPDHPETLSSMEVLGRVYAELRRPREAEPLLVEALAGQRRRLGDDHAATLLTMHRLGSLLLETGRLDEAEPLIVEYVDRVQRNANQDERARMTAMNNMAYLWMRQGRLEEAESGFREVVTLSERLLGPDDSTTADHVANLAGVLVGQERHDEAAVLFERALVVQRRELGETHPKTLITINNLAGSLRELERYEEATGHFAEGVRLHRAAMPAGFFGTGVTMSGYGECLTKLERFDEAEAALLEAQQILEAAVGAEHDWATNCAKRLADLYDAWGRPDDAAPWRARSEPPAAEPDAEG